MLYIVNIFLSCLYLRWVNINRWTDLWKALPVMILWTLIAGGQYYVGADYEQYFRFFNHPFGLVKSRYEWLFAEITGWSIDMGIYGQGVFFVFAALNILLLFMAGVRAKVKHWGIYYILLITWGAFFHNQMNAVRQATAVCLCFIAFMEFYDRKWLGVILILIAGSIHNSSYVCILFLFIKPFAEVGNKYPIAMLLIAFGSTFVSGLTENFNYMLIDLLPDSISSSFRYEDSYKGSGFNVETSMIYRVSKIIMIPLYWKSLELIKRNELNKWQQFLFGLGFFCFMMRNVLLINMLMGRFSFYFWLPSIFPIYYLMVHYWQQKKIIPFIIVQLWLLIPYVAKLIAGTQNFESSFIYFR